MWVLFVVLNETYRLPDLLDALRRLDVNNLTVMHSASYEEVLLRRRWPSFTQLRWLPGQQLVHTDTVFALLEGEDRLRAAVGAAESVLNLAGAEAGFLFAFPVGLVRGLPYSGDIG